MSIYKENEILIFVQYLKRAIAFYEKLFEVKITQTYKDRWAKVPGNLLFLINKNYDFKHGIATTSHEKKPIFGNTCVPVYLTDDIDAEYIRISKISNDVSELCYLNLLMPYRFFTFKDSEGNIIEIGHYPKK
jgi:predicted enzyme related to lactoylglutathione lyase